MFTYEIIAAAIVGGIAGGVSGSLQRIVPAHDEKKKKRVFLIGFFSLFAILQAISLTPAVKSRIMTSIDKDYVIKEKIKERLYRIVELPAVKEKLETFDSSGEAEAYAQGLVHQGLKRLTYEELVSWNDLRMKLALRSPAMCAGLWSGQITENLVLSSLSQLNETDLNRWVTISNMAAIDEVQEIAYPEVSQEDFKLGLQAISLRLTNVDQEKLKAVLVQGLKAKPDDACFAMKTILKNETLPESVRENFLRFLASM